MDSTPDPGSTGNDPPCRESLTISSPELSLDVMRHGATVRRLRVAGLPEGSRNVVLGHADPGQYGTAPGYLGATVGRFANRLRGGRFVVDDHSYQVTLNEGANTLHGGVDGFDNRCWELLEHTPSRVRLTLVSPHLDQGFPGELRVVATYEVRSSAVHISYEAVTDRPTPVNLTNHTYLNLHGEGVGTVVDHRLTVLADALTEIGTDLVPTGRLLPVGDTPLDLGEPRRIGDVVGSDHPQLGLAGGLDHNYVLRETRDERTGLRIAGILSVPDLRLSVLTDQPGVQVYAGGQLDATAVGDRGQVYGPGAGVALECQNFPDAPNHPEFPDAILRPGETYRATTVWRLSRVPSAG